MLDASTSIYNLEYNRICTPSSKFSTFLQLLFVNECKKILQILNLLINLVIIFNNSCSIHRKCQDFYGVHVYLRSNRISLLPTPSNIYSPRVNFTIYLHFLTTHLLTLESTFPNLLHNLFLCNPSRYFFFTWLFSTGFDPRSLGALNVSQPTYPLDHDAPPPSKYFSHFVPILSTTFSMKVLYLVMN